MQSVSRFEANLLRLLYYILGNEARERAVQVFDNAHDAPPCLSPGAVRLIRDALARGCVRLLAQRGGWRQERFLCTGQPRLGRLWERTPPADLGLTFSPHSLTFLLALTADRPSKETWGWHVGEKELTDGDRLLLFFAHEALRTAPSYVKAPWRRKQPWNRHALCWLAYPEDYAHLPATAVPNFVPWMSGTGACILEALQADLARRWEQVEGSKEHITAPEAMRGLGQSQERVLTSFLDAIDTYGRWDLARFLLRVLAAMLGPHAHAGMWTGRLETTGLVLADRAAIYQDALALLRQASRLQEWARRARAIGYFDDGYAAAQLWKADWEQVQGETLCERAVELGRQLDPIKRTAVRG